MPPPVTAAERLYEIALDHFGLVTFAQAQEVAVTAQTLSKLVRRGRIGRVSHGVYRIPWVPATVQEPFMRAVLWTGTAEACLSHDTALAARHNDEVSTAAIHLTVGAKSRLRRAGGERYIVHHENLAPEQVDWWQGVPCVTMATAIEQCITSGAPADWLRQAIADAGQSDELPPEDCEHLTGLLGTRQDGRRPSPGSSPAVSVPLRPARRD